MKPTKRWVAVTAVMTLCVACGLQARAAEHVHRELASNLVVPQSRVFHAERQGAVQITGVDVAVVVLEQVATTTMEINLHNPTRSRLEAEVIVPVSDGAAVRGFTFQGATQEPTAELLPKDEARKIYDSIVAKMKDPALLEFVGYNLIRSSVFPVDAGGDQKVRLVYEHLLPADGNRVDYVLPRTESVEYSVPWNITVKIKAKHPISTVFSPSHPLDVTRQGENVVAAKTAEGGTREPGAFRVSYLLEQNGVTASLLAYPDAKAGGGYFLLLAGLPAKPPEGAGRIRREVTMVLDRSGSMRGEKLEQVREAAMQILAGLDEDEAFNIIAYNEGVDFFAPAPVLKTAEAVAAAHKYLEGIKASGGTNIHDALLEALRQKPTGDMLPLVLFFTDGLPTIGQTAETVIREIATKANPHKRRVFTFGVGVDVNTPLLEGIALDTRATSTFVLPQEDVEVKVSSVFKRLSGPILAEPVLAVLGDDGKPAMGRTRDILPGRLPDLFEGDQLVLLGQYVGEEPLHFTISGNYLGTQRTFTFDFSVDKATTKNAFVPRLWATRKIAVLIDAIRALGADDGTWVQRPDPANDPRLKELVDEVVRLSREFGILTEYTAFFASEGTDLSNADDVFAATASNFSKRALNTRSGWGSYNQAYNIDIQRAAKSNNYTNTYLDENLQRVEITSVQQINDRAFYRRGRRWVDSRVVDEDADAVPDEVIEVGSPEFKKLVEQLVSEDRQGTVSLQGEILMKMNDRLILVK